MAMAHSRNSAIPGGPYTVSPTSAVIKERLPKSPGNPKMWSPWRWVMKILVTCCRLKGEDKS